MRENAKSRGGDDTLLATSGMCFCVKYLPEAAISSNGSTTSRRRLQSMHDY